jgi:hypothetical protein
VQYHNQSAAAAAAACTYATAVQHQWQRIDLGAMDRDQHTLKHDNMQMYVFTVGDSMLHQTLVNVSVHACGKCGNGGGSNPLAY